jgi:hypothetical protein
MNTATRKPVSGLAIGLLACAALWLVGMCAWYANSHSKDGWSQTPLLWILVLVATPVLCAIAAGTLVYWRCRLAERLTWLDWCALMAGSVTVVVGGWLLLMVSGSMRGMGIL